jgi:N-methylhydantoinase A/oxoprolinase/acetone carboxylase beta subunit
MNADRAGAGSGTPPEIRLGLDTGGTYTDAIALDGARRVLASAKTRTTHWDLAIGIREAIHALLAALPAGVRREHIVLVSVSTTLATNAVVEGRFSPICTLLVGFDERMVERSGLKRGGGGSVVSIRGGHDATGEEVEPLDEGAVQSAVDEFHEARGVLPVAHRLNVAAPALELGKLIHREQPCAAFEQRGYAEHRVVDEEVSLGPRME